MSNKSKFLNSAKLAIAGVVLTSSLASCKMMSCKHKCSSEGTPSAKEEKAKCSSKKATKAAPKAKEEKAKCSSVAKEEKAKCSSKKAE